MGVLGGNHFLSELKVPAATFDYSTVGQRGIALISCFHPAFLKSVTFYWPTNALNCIKLKG